MSRNLIVFSMYDFFNVSESVAMASRKPYTKSAYTRSWHIKIAREIGLWTLHRMISVSPRYIISMDYGSVSRIACLFLLRLLYLYWKLGRKWYIKLYNTLKNTCPAGIWKISCWTHIIAWIYCRSIVIHKALVLDGSLHYL